MTIVSSRSSVGLTAFEEMRLKWTGQWGTYCVFLITELQCKYSIGNQAGGNHEEGSENAGWIVLKRI